MIYFAGTFDPVGLVHAAGPRNWAVVAAGFFLAEAATVAVMGWFIVQVAGTGGLAIGLRQAYLLAGIAPNPLWLSSLGLRAPDVVFNLALALIGTGLSCGIVYQGLRAFCRPREDLTAAAIVHTVIGAILAGWAFLLAIVLL